MDKLRKRWIGIVLVLKEIPFWINIHVYCSNVTPTGEKFITQSCNSYCSLLFNARNLPFYIEIYGKFIEKVQLVLKQRIIYGRALLSSHKEPVIITLYSSIKVHLQSNDMLTNLMKVIKIMKRQLWNGWTIILVNQTSSIFLNIYFDKMNICILKRCVKFAPFITSLIMKPT